MSSNDELSSDRTVNYFQTPTDPEGFTLSLASILYRQIDFSALEFNTLQRAVTEYVRTYYREQFNDFVSSNGFMMLTELLCYIGSVLSQRGDVLVNEAFFPTSFTWDAAENHMNLIGQNARRQTPATVQIMCTIDQPVATDIRIPSNGETSFNVVGPDGTQVTYELYSAPYDWMSDIIIPARKYGVVGWAIEGRFDSPVNNVSTGGPDQQIVITADNIIDEPINVTVDNIPWTRVGNIEQYGSGDLIFTVRFIEGGMIIKFGDDVNGKAPISGQVINVRYRIGGGMRGRIGTNAINQSRAFAPDTPASATTQVRFVNALPSIGGYDAETIDEVKLRTPKTWATHGFISTDGDYRTKSENFVHPVYGGVMKAVATVHTSLNANVIRVSILGDGEDGVPSRPSLGLKQGLETYLSQSNVLTDSIDVVDGKIKTVDFEANVVMYRNTDASIIREQVESAIDDFFNIRNWEMGQPLYVSALYDTITAINGIRYVDIFKPKDDILKLSDVGVAKLSSGYYADAKDRLESIVNSSTEYYDIIMTDLENYVFTLDCTETDTGCDNKIQNLILDFNSSYFDEDFKVVIEPLDCSSGYSCSQSYVFGTYTNAVDYDELITQGQRNIRYYYERPT